MKCDCKKMSCEKHCDRKHTHKVFFCEICEPVNPPSQEQWENVNTPDFGTKLESIKHIGDMVDGKMVCREDCPSVTHRKTPDTEFDSDKEVVGSDCMCVLGSKKHNPECEYATPDIEVEEMVEAIFDEYPVQFTSSPKMGKRQRVLLEREDVVSIISSRDTYWKERVRKEVERIKGKKIYRYEQESDMVISKEHVLQALDNLK